MKNSSKNKKNLKDINFPLIKNKKYDNVVSKVKQIFNKTKIIKNKNEENENNSKNKNENTLGNKKISTEKSTITTTTAKLLNGIKSDFNKKFQKKKNSKSSESPNTIKTTHSKSPSLLREINESIKNSQKVKKNFLNFLKFLSFFFS